MKIIKCYGYGRHSADKKGDNATEDEQKTRCMAYWRENLQPHGVEWGGWYYDPDVSAKYDWSERPAGRELALRMQRDDWLVVDDHTRLFRKPSHAHAWHDKFAERGWHVHELNLLACDQMEFPEANLNRGMSYLMAGYYRDNSSRREIKRVAYCKEKGLPWGPHAPPGWKVVKVNGRREFRANVREREIIDFMQTLADDGMNHEEIASWWLHEDRRGRWGQTGMRKENRGMRRMSTANIVRWMLRARLAGYPLIGSKEEFCRAWNSGEITCHTA